MNGNQALRWLKSEEKSCQPFFRAFSMLSSTFPQMSSHNSSIRIPQDFCVRIVRQQQNPLTSIRALSVIENVSVCFTKCDDPTLSMIKFISLCFAIRMTNIHKCFKE